ncbi:ABC transporter ATP-binding protein [Streptomyces sp. 4N509B]|uniref:ABC transporter ATP-binding protein n=1 Tax=Streptomyces sp. 4N509B TaxID=3457413 RepID=UPI003FD2F6E6
MAETTRDPGQAPLLELDGVTVRFDRPRHTALDAVDLAVAEHQTVCVLGPSGSGKSTLLRAVAGLTPVDGGAIRLAGRDQAGVPAHRRGVGLMFQDHQLFPQLDVAGNISFGLRVRRTPRAEVTRRVAELLDLVGLPGAQRRAVATLSGGEQQRVALARALAPGPRLLMLDEPLGALDRTLRERLVVELRQLFRRLGTTVLAVTHDQGEAFALADRVVVMREGRVAQSGTPAEVWQRPADAATARFLGFHNLAEARVGEGDGAADSAADGAADGASRRVADTPWGPVPVPAGTPSGRHQLLIRPSGLALTSPEDEAATVRCTVRARTFRGDHLVLFLTPERGPELQATCPPRSAPPDDTRVGVVVDPAEVVTLPPAAG